MKRSVVVAVGIVCMAGAGARGQITYPFIGETKQNYTIVKNNLICDAALDALTDASASQMVRLGQSSRERSKLGLLFGMTSHSNEQYGYMAVYLRLKGIVPPSTEAQ
jgi:hypothetical protein